MSKQIPPDDLEERVAILEERLDRVPTTPQEMVARLVNAGVDRRTVMQLVAGGGLAALATGTASAQSTNEGGVLCSWFGDQNANGHTLYDAGLIETDGLIVRQGRGLLGLPTHHINYASGLSDEEVARFTLEAGEQLELWRLELSLKGGGTDANVSIEVFDATNTTSLGSVTAGSRSEGGSSPLGTSGAGATVTVRMSTGGSAVDVCPTGITAVVSA